LTLADDDVSKNRLPPASTCAVAAEPSNTRYVQALALMLTRRPSRFCAAAIRRARASDASNRFPGRHVAQAAMPRA